MYALAGIVSLLIYFIICAGETQSTMPIPL